MNKDALKQLAALVARRNALSTDIARLIRRPAFDGHIAEFIASEVFGIDLHGSAANKSFDGRFNKGDFAAKSVNIKWRGKNDGTLNLSPTAPPPDFYLVLAGATSSPGSSRGADRPWLLEAVYFFEALALGRALRDRGIKIGTASGVAQEAWREAEVFPVNRNKHLQLDDVAREALSWFAVV
jgi:hypothetical protein